MRKSKKTPKSYVKKKKTPKSTYLELKAVDFDKTAADLA